MSKKAKEALQSNDERLLGLLSGLVHADQIKKEQEHWRHTDTPITYKGKKIILPGDPVPMSTPDAIAALKRKEEDENQEVDAAEVIDAFPLDGAVAFIKALRYLYGWASPIPTPGFFGPENPRMITVQTGIDTSVQVPWGQFKVPGIENPIQVSSTRTPNGQAFVISGTIRKREQTVIKQIADVTRDILKTESIYRGKAIRLRVDYEGDLALDIPPQFIDTSEGKQEDLIVSRSIEEQIETSLLTPIKQTASCLKNNIPLNRGVLLEGKYGTGKTMTAMVTAKACEENNWTFILLDKVQGLKEALLFAQRYQPAVVFAEDIDRIADDRDEDGNDLLNTIDGALTKSSQVITCLTTNYVEKIHNAMLRPGRLDAIISITPPDAEAVGRLIRLYARDLLDENESLDEVGAILDGQIPATIREVVERAKLAMISREGGSIKETDLVIAATGMTRHLELLNGKEEKVISPEEKLGIAARDLLVGKNLEQGVSNVYHEVKQQAAVTREVVFNKASDIQKVQEITGKRVKKIHDKVV
jgi:transitional endoplasmic reticulum ATPase